MTRVVQIIGSSPYGDYKNGEYGFLEGFVRGGDNTPCAVVSLKDGRFVCVPVYHLKRIDDDTKMVGLDGAAEEYTEENASSCDYIGAAKVEDAFKAGANWMAGQFSKNLNMM